MKDKELFDFFKNRSESFDEMPSANVWTNINKNSKIPKKTSFLSMSKIVTWSIYAIIAILTCMLFMPKEAQKGVENIIKKPIQEETILETNPSTNQNLTEIDSAKKKSDTLKTKKIFIKKNVANNLKYTVPVLTNHLPILKSDTIVVLDSTVAIDSLIISPQIKGNRLFFETKQSLTVSEFESFVQKIVEQNKTNYGSLIVIRAKGNKPFRQLIKFPEKTLIPKTTIQPVFYTAKPIMKDSIITIDSIYFNIKK